MLDDREWQAQRIVGEQQTPFGLEHDFSVQKTLWPPRAALDTKLVWRYRGGQREAGSEQRPEFARGGRRHCRRRSAW
jgi:hypothetical protein